MATITLNLPDRENDVLEALCAEQEISKTILLRQALCLYQLIHERLRDGETFHFSGDQQRAVLFVGPGFATRRTPEHKP